MWVASIPPAVAAAAAAAAAVAISAAEKLHCEAKETLSLLCNSHSSTWRPAAAGTLATAAALTADGATTTAVTALAWLLADVWAALISCGRA